MADPIIRTPKGVSPDRFLDMVRAGVFDAMRELMSTGTTNPSADFFAAVKDGVEAAVKATVRLRETPPPPERQEAQSSSAPVQEEGQKP